MRLTLWLVVVSLLSLSWLYTGSLAQAQPAQAQFDRNLIVNGDAEAGLGAPDDHKAVPPPSWTVTGNFSVVQYGASGGFPSATDLGPASRGRNFFAGGPSNERSEAVQDITLAASADIDAGSVGYRLAGYLGGFESQADNAVLKAVFIGEGDAKLGEIAIGPVTPAQRQNKTGLMSGTAMGIVPKGTRKVRVTITMTRSSGSYNDGSADNLELVLTRK